MKRFVVSFYLANKWGNMIEKQQPIVVASLWEARAVADRTLLSLQSRGKGVYPYYDLAEEAA
jgi:hypothetical protein